MNGNMTQSYRSLTLIYLLINVCIVYGYKASVVEYSYQYADYLSSTDNLMRNAVLHANLIRLFSKKSDIIVFPEDSLLPVGGSKAAYISVPLPSFQNTNFSNKALQMISDAAKSANIYVVINVPERDGKQTYSTNIAFRRNGTIAAKYRKYNVGGNDINRPTLEAVTFTTDFGVTFGLISFSDLLFPSPADDLVKQGVKHFVCLSSWSSHLPFLTAAQIQQSWSWSRDVTLLAAGLNIVESGQTGSGIYTGRKGHLTRSPYKYYFANIPTTMIITTNLQASDQKGGYDNSLIDFNLKKLSLKRQKYSWMLPRFSSSKDTEYVQATDNELIMTKPSFKPFTTKLISPSRNCAQVTPGGDLAWRCRYDEQLCNKNICCNFNLTVDYFLCNNPCSAESSVSGLNLDDGFFLFRYRMAVFEGVKRLGVGPETWGAQICGIIPCIDETIEGCGGKPDLSQYKTYVFNFGGRTAKVWAESIRSVHITGNFTTNNSTIMPNILLGKTAPSFSFGLLTNDFNLKTSNNSATLQLPDQTRNLGAVGIINRLYSLDGLSVTGSQQSVHGSLLISLIITQIFVSLVL